VGKGGRGGEFWHDAHSAFVHAVSSLHGRTAWAKAAHGRVKIETLWPPLPTLQLLAQWRPAGLYLYTLLIFAASRLVVLIGVQFGTLLVPVEKPGKWETGPASYHRLLQWDSGWYASIVHNGYSYSTDPAVHSSTVFFPLYPLVAAAVKTLPGIDEYLALLIVANAASVAAVLLMTRFFADELDAETALMSVALFSFFPSSLFLSAGYTESLCLAFILLSFILLHRDRYVPAAAAAGLALCRHRHDPRHPVGDVVAQALARSAAW
jgi:hypothetical protein